MPFPAGRRLRPYEIPALLGEGDMRGVCLMRDWRFDRIGGMQALGCDFGSRPEAPWCFEREAPFAAALRLVGQIGNALGREGGFGW